MQGFEYKVVAAPRRAARIKGVRSAEERFARAVEAEMNRMAGEGWEYVRSDTLPCDERKGWFGGSVTVDRPLLVFRRAVVPEAVEVAWSRPAPAPQAPTSPPMAAPVAPAPRPEPLPRMLQTPRAVPVPSPVAAASLSPVSRAAPSPGGAPPPPAAARPASRFAVRPERAPGTERLAVLEQALARTPVADPRPALRTREAPVAAPTTSEPTAEDDEVSIPGPTTGPSRGVDDARWPDPAPGRPPRV